MSHISTGATRLQIQSRPARLVRTKARGNTLRVSTSDVAGRQRKIEDVVGTGPAGAGAQAMRVCPFRISVALQMPSRLTAQPEMAMVWPPSGGFR